MRINPSIAGVAVLALLVSGCAASSRTFYANPTKVGDTNLCRTFMEAWNKGDQRFASDTANEASSRGLTYEKCQQKIAAEDAAMVGIAVIATAVGVAVACQNGCGGGSGGYSRDGADQDCLGGPGDGPYFVQGPVQVGGYDPHDLDRDGDGIGCEAGDFGA